MDAVFGGLSILIILLAVQPGYEANRIWLRSWALARKRNALFCYAAPRAALTSLKFLFSSTYYYYTGITASLYMNN